MEGRTLRPCACDARCGVMKARGVRNDRSVERRPWSLLHEQALAESVPMSASFLVIYCAAVCDSRNALIQAKGMIGSVRNPSQVRAWVVRNSARSNSHRQRPSRPMTTTAPARRCTQGPQSPITWAECLKPKPPLSPSSTPPPAAAPAPRATSLRGCACRPRTRPRACPAPGASRRRPCCAPAQRHRLCVRR